MDIFEADSCKLNLPNGRFSVSYAFSVEIAIWFFVAENFYKIAKQKKKRKNSKILLFSFQIKFSSSKKILKNSNYFL